MQHTAGNRRWPRLLWRVALHSFVLKALILVAPAVLAEDFEIKPFSLIDVNAVLDIGYQYDEFSFGQTSRDSTVWQEELSLRTRSYVYHPGFLNVGLDLRPRLVQQDVTPGDASSATSESLLGYDLRLNFLNLKRYPFSVYTRRTYPSSFVGPVASYRTKNDEHGFRTMIRGPARSSLKLGISRNETDGEGFDSIIDDSIDRQGLSISLPYGQWGLLDLMHERITQDSSSGSPGLPIQQSLLRQDNLVITARNSFGERGSSHLNQTLNLFNYRIESGQVSNLDSVRYNVSSRIKFDETKSSALGYSYNSVERLNSDSRAHLIRAGFSHELPNDLNYGIRTQFEDSRATGQDRRAAKIGGDIRYSLDTRFGTVMLNGFADQERIDQRSTADTVTVFDEALVLAGTTPIALANESVVASSVVIVNESRTQTFVEGLDYRLIVIGSTTSVERLIDGNILDGQVVLAEYNYRTTGTAEYGQLNSGASASIDILNFARASISYTLTDTKVRAGELTLPANDRQEIEFSLVADRRLQNGWSIGGSYRFVDNDEEIAPSVLSEFRLRASTVLIGALRFNITGELTKVDQQTSPEDVDQRSVSLGLGGRLIPRLDLSYDLYYVDDAGGSRPRQRLQHRLKASWDYRNVSVRMYALLSGETQGAVERDDKRIRVDVSRLF